MYLSGLEVQGRNVIGLFLHVSPNPHVLNIEAARKFMTFDGIISDFFLRGGAWSEEAGHCGSDLSLFVLLFLPLSHCASWPLCYQHISSTSGHSAALLTMQGQKHLLIVSQN